MRNLHSVTVITKALILVTASAEIVWITCHLRMIPNDKVIMGNHFTMTCRTHLSAMARGTSIPIPYPMCIDHVRTMNYSKDRIGILVLPQSSAVTSVTSCSVGAREISQMTRHTRLHSITRFPACCAWMAHTAMTSRAAHPFSASGMINAKSSIINCCSKNACMTTKARIVLNCTGRILSWHYGKYHGVPNSLIETDLPSSTLNCMTRHAANIAVHRGFKFLGLSKVTA